MTTEIAGLTPDEARFILDTMRRVKAAGILDTTSYIERIKKRLPRDIDDGLGEVRFFKLIGDVRAGSALARVCDKTGTELDASSSGVRVYEMVGYLQNALADYWGLFIKLDGKWRFWQGPCVDTSCSLGTSEIDEDTPPTGYVNEAYTHTIILTDLLDTATASGLPPGLYFDGDSGDITGTPTAAGIYTVVITGSSDPNECPVTTAFELTIEECDVGTSYIDPDDPPDGEDGVAYSHFVLFADLDGDPEVDGLPPGLVFDGTTGEIDGTPTEEGTWTVTATGVSVVNGCTIVEEFQLTIGPCDPGDSRIFAMSSYGGLYPATINEPYNASFGWVDIDLPLTLYTGGSGYDFPNGLSFNGSVGTIEGTPVECGQFFFEIRGDSSENGCQISRKFSLLVYCECPDSDDYTTLTAWITGAGSPTSASTIFETVGVSQTLTTSNCTFNTSPPTVTGLPDGLSWNPVAGEVTGIPTTQGEYTTVFWGTVTSGDYAGCLIKHTRTYTVSEPPP